MWRSLVCCLLLVSGFGGVTGERLSAQAATGSLSGTVVDAGHAVLLGARIEIEPRGVIAVSDEQGHFTIQNVVAGEYHVTVSYLGLLPYTAKVTVTRGESARVDAVLQVPGVKEEVTVSAARPRGAPAGCTRRRS